MSQSGMLSVTSGTLPPNVPLTFTGNVGIATPVSHNLNVVTANSTPQFVGSGSTLTLDFALTNLLLGSSGSGITSGIVNAGFGFGSLFSISSGISNAAFGYGSLGSLTTGNSNTGIGASNLTALQNGFSNTSVGARALSKATSANVNSVFGSDSLSNLSTGSQNLVLGSGAGAAYTTSESNNILISNNGIIGESNVMRIGTTGSGGGQVNKTFIAAITGVTAVGSPVAVSSTGQLSNLGFGSSTQVLTSNGAGVSPTWQAAATGTVTSVSGTANQVSVASGTTTPVISLIGPYTPSTYTAHGVLLGEGTSSIVATSVGATGTVLTGSTGADPSFSATPSVTSITLGGGSALGNYVTAGTFTPTIVGTVAGTTTYSTQTGNYTRIGNIVVATFIITITAATGTGTAILGGLPFSNTVGNQRCAFYINPVSTTWPYPAGTTYLEAFLLFGSATANIIAHGSSVVSAPLQMANAAASFYGQFVYLI